MGGIESRLIPGCLARVCKGSCHLLVWQSWGKEVGSMLLQMRRKQVRTVYTSLYMHGEGKGCECKLGV